MLRDLLSDNLLEVLLVAFLIPLGKSLWGWVKAHRKAATPSAQRRAAIEDENQSIGQLRQANAELGQDLDDSRRRHREDNDRHAAREREWEAREAMLRAEVARLEEKLQALAQEIAEIKWRHNIA